MYNLIESKVVVNRTPADHLLGNTTTDSSKRNISKLLSSNNI